MVPITSSLLSWASLLGEKNDVRPREEIKMTKTFLVCKKLVTKWGTSVQFSSVSQSCPTLCDPHQAPPSLGFSRQEHWSGLPFPSLMHESEKWKGSHLVMSDSFGPHEPQHTRPHCPSPTPGVHRNPCPSSWWSHPTISSSVIPFSSCPQSFPASRSFPMSQFSHRGPKHWGFSFNISPSNEHPGLISFRMDWLDHLAVQGTLKSLFQHHSSKA